DAAGRAAGSVEDDQAYGHQNGEAENDDVSSSFEPSECFEHCFSTFQAKGGLYGRRTNACNSATSLVFGFRSLSWASCAAMHKRPKTQNSRRARVCSIL